MSTPETGPLKLYTGDGWISLAEAMAVLTALRLSMERLDAQDIAIVKIRCERTANAADLEGRRRAKIRERVDTPGHEAMADAADAELTREGE